MAQGGAPRRCALGYEELGSAESDGAVDIDGEPEAGADITGASDEGAAMLGAVVSAGRVGDAPVLLGVQAATAPAATNTESRISRFIENLALGRPEGVGDGPLWGSTSPT